MVPCFGWAVVVPAAIATLGFFNVFYVGAVVLFYSFYRAIRKALKLLGITEYSEAEKEKIGADLEMRHHHYHCKRNPAGFERLRDENFMNDERAQIQQESQELIGKEE